MGQRLLVLGLAGVLLTVTVVVTALLAVRDVSSVNAELARVSRALNHHKTAEEMHDALRTDVARAQLVGAGVLTVSPQALRRETRRDAARFRAALRAAAAVELRPPLKTPLNRLRPVQETYIITAEQMVDAALSPKGVTPGAQADYDAAFGFLAPEQRRMTSRLVATSTRAQAATITQREQAERTITLAAAAALAGWLTLAGWHHRSMRHLQAALVREADQRATADLLKQSLLPHRLPAIAGARLAARSVPGNAKNRIGGDWYDALTLPTGQVFLVLGDVVGHDLPAATVMGQLRNLVRAYALEDSSPRSVLTRVNRAAHLLQTSDLATCVCVVLTPETMTMTWASAGHPPPLLAPLGRPRHLLAGEPGPPLGVVLPADYPEHELHLGAGDTLLLYSDGLVERRGIPLDAGLAALETVSVPDTDPEVFCAHLIETLLEGNANRDDTTCLALQAHPPQATAVGALTTFREAADA